MNQINLNANIRELTLLEIDNLKSKILNERKRQIKEQQQIFRTIASMPMYGKAVSAFKNKKNHCISETQIKNFLMTQTKLLTEFEDYQESLKSTLKETKQRIDQKMQKLQQIKDQNTAKKTIIDQYYQYIQNLQDSYTKLNQKEEIATEEYVNLRIERIKRTKDFNSLKAINQERILNNWQTQTELLKFSIKQRAQINKKIIFGLRAKELLANKIKQQAIQKSDILLNKQKNESLIRQNNQLKIKLQKQMQRKHHLQEIKTSQVNLRAVQSAMSIAEDWHDISNNCTNSLNGIIETINKGLPSRKLKDIEEILKKFENFQSQESSIENSQSRKQLKEDSSKLI